ncbi:hypothetical protein [Nonomuraea dietziae]|uniref:hypothetical protein n=1 Tax=Nonomuraea dietziae TaxID=65515 RepID=UPI0031E1BF05
MTSWAATVTWPWRRRRRTTTRVDTLTGEGAGRGADGRAGGDRRVELVPSFEPAAVLEFFETSTGNLLAAEAAGPASVTTSRCRSWDGADA